MLQGNKALDLVLKEGEGSQVEFKERIAHLDREMVAFANTSGGTIYVGVNDKGEAIGITIDNKLRSQICDIARNCDPSITVELTEYSEKKVLAIKVKSGQDKPYRCKDGFFNRVGPSAQKLTRDEIINVIKNSPKFNFDEQLNRQFQYPNDFSKKSLNVFKQLCNITGAYSDEDILLSLNIARNENKNLVLMNTAVLFFAENPQEYFPESYMTCVCYKSYDRFDIIDKKDFSGTLFEQVENALQFLQRHMSVQMNVAAVASSAIAQREDIYDYPIVALREALVNAVVHRDYHYDGSHIYVHLFPDRLEIESPGGLYYGLDMENLGQRSVRRNRLIADLMHRAGYIERVGSGIPRIKESLKKNNNPPMDIVANNYFIIRFQKRLVKPKAAQLSPRQLTLLKLVSSQVMVTKQQLMQHMNVSDDTVLNDLRILLKEDLIERRGRGKATVYLSKHND